MTNEKVWTCEWCGAKHSSMEAYQEHQRQARHPGSAQAERISEDRLRNTRAWAAARIGQLSGAEVIVGAIDELLQMREDWKTICEAAERLPDEPSDIPSCNPCTQWDEDGLCVTCGAAFPQKSGAEPTLVPHQRAWIDAASREPPHCPTCECGMAEPPSAIVSVRPRVFTHGLTLTQADINDICGTAFEVRNGPDSLPCDHCGKTLNDHLLPGLICPSAVRTTGK